MVEISRFEVIRVEIIRFEIIRFEIIRLEIIWFEISRVEIIRSSWDIFDFQYTTGRLWLTIYICGMETHLPVCPVETRLTVIQSREKRRTEGRRQRSESSPVDDSNEITSLP